MHALLNGTYNVCGAIGNEYIIYFETSSVEITLDRLILKFFSDLYALEYISLASTSVTRQ
jgi:hypothetical protein